MDIHSILEALRRGQQLADILLPAVRALGGPNLGEASDIVASVVNIANNVLTRIQEGSIVASTSEQAEIQQIIAQLQHRNDDLNQIIQSS